MTTSILDRVPVESMAAEARQIRFWATMAALVGWLLFRFGWLLAKGFAKGTGVFWFAGAYVFVAVRRGYRAGRGVPVGPSEPY